MMGDTSLRYQQLEAVLAKAGEFSSNAKDLISEWIDENVGIEAVSSILMFMESHAAVDMGLPGPLVHFVERFYKRGYESLLVGSVRRRPTTHTLWMLNRIINGSKEIAERRVFVDTLRDVCANAVADESVLVVARRFLALHAGAQRS